MLNGLNSHQPQRELKVPRAAEEPLDTCGTGLQQDCATIAPPLSALGIGNDLLNKGLVLSYSSNKAVMKSIITHFVLKHVIMCYMVLQHRDYVRKGNSVLRLFWFEGSLVVPMCAICSL